MSPVLPRPLRATRAALALGLALGAADASRAEWSGTPALRWERCPPAFCERGWYASPAVAQLDADPALEVLWGGYTLLAVDGDTGTLEWSYPSSARLWPSPAVADLDRDGAPEIAVANGDGLVSVLDATGEFEPGWPRIPLGPGEIRTLAVADLDGGPTRELAIARAASTASEQWSVLESDGTTRPGWPERDVGDAGFAAGCYNQNLAIADLDGDGRGEIAASSDVHYLAAFEDDGTSIAASALFGAGKVWSQVGLHQDPAVDLRGFAQCGAADPLEPRANFADSAPAIADLDGDGTLEVVIVGSFYDCREGGYPQLFQLPIVLRPDRTRWAAGPYDWTELPTPDGDAAPLSTDFDQIETALPNPALADLDGDGTLEILHASYDGRLHAVRLDRSEVPGWPVDLNPIPGPIRFASEPAVADLDGDGLAEVVFATWTEKGSDLPGTLEIVDAAGASRASVPLPWDPATTWGGALGAPTLANVDADGDLEVLVGTVDRGLVAYDLPDTAGARVLWATSRGGFARAAPEPSAALAGVAAAVVLAGLGRRRPAGERSPAR